MSEIRAQLERYFFPHQEIRANAHYDINGDRSGNKVQIAVHNARQIPERETAFTIDVTISLDEENSVNPPYFFKVQAFGIFVIPEGVASAFDPKSANQEVLPLLIGAIREPLAAMTARGPWGPFFVGLIAKDSPLED